ncbi:hypothetical protein EDD18DRAFT_1082687, partial [Armillaria luteobubalina]
SRFNNTQIACVELLLPHQGSKYEMLRRLQLSIALTPAERLQVIAGYQLPCLAACTI